MKTYCLLFIVIMSLASFKPDNKKAKKNPILFGIDVSQYQGNIDWGKVKKSNKITFVLIRASMGSDREDDNFQRNFTQAKKQGLVIGAYHYYDPNESSEKQALNYLNSVKLRKGNFIPIVDLERLSTIQSSEKLKAGLKNWLRIVESKYGVKPILYTGYKFFDKYLDADFSKYPLWVAAYDNDKRNSKIVKDAEIHQFCCNAPIPGINCKVDGNDVKRSKFYSLLLTK